MNGRFITFEGIEGVGKTTHIERLREWLQARGRKALVTREPGGTPLGEAIRDLLLDRDRAAMAADAELLLMFAARAEHLEKVIRPALAAGRWILCDRFTDASYAYQGGGRGIEESRIGALQQWVQSDLRPHRTLLLDADVELGLARAGRQGAADRFEQEDVQFFERVRQTYLRLAAGDPQRFRVIDATRPQETVWEAVRSALDDMLDE